MDITFLKTFFMWCTIIDFGLLLIMFLIFVVTGGDWVYRLHGRWFPMPKESFNVVIYSFIGGFKMLWMIFNVVPYIALVIMDK